jgi:hypothetical protein
MLFLLAYLLLYLLSNRADPVNNATFSHDEIDPTVVDSRSGFCIVQRASTGQVLSMRVNFSNPSLL